MRREPEINVELRITGEREVAAWRRVAAARGVTIDDLFIEAVTERLDGWIETQEQRLDALDRAHRAKAG